MVGEGGRRHSYCPPPAAGSAVDGDCGSRGRQVFVHTNHRGVSSPEGPLDGTSSREGRVTPSNYFREDKNGKQM